MKKNLVFGGVMAAILVSVGAANAATTTIATKGYVDSVEAKIPSTEQIKAAAIAAGDEKYESASNKTNTVEGLTDTQKANMFPTVAAVEAAIDGLDLGLTTDEINAIKNADVSKLSEDITKLKGDESVTGSVAEKIATALEGYTPTTTLESTYATKSELPDAQVQADWNVTDTDSVAYIANKPTVPTTESINTLITAAIGDEDSGLVKEVADLQTAIGDGTTAGLAKDVKDLQDAGYVTESELETATSDFITKNVNDLTNYTKTSELETTLAGKNIKPQVQADWTESDEDSAAYIANKPTIPSAESVSALTEAIGDGTTGLLADVAGLQETVGNSTSGLVKNVNTLETVVGDDDSGLVQLVNAATAALEDKIPQPTGDCASANNTCVLSVKLVNGEKEYSWVAVTTPVDDPVSGSGD